MGGETGRIPELLETKAKAFFRSPKPQLPLAEQSVFSGLVVLRVAPAN